MPWDCGEVCSGVREAGRSGGDSKAGRRSTAARSGSSTSGLSSLKRVTSAASVFAGCGLLSNFFRWEESEPRGASPPASFFRTSGSPKAEDALGLRRSMFGGSRGGAVWRRLESGETLDCSQEWQQYFRTEQPQTSYLCHVRLCLAWAVEQLFFRWEESEPRGASSPATFFRASGSPTAEDALGLRRMMLGYSRGGEVWRRLESGETLDCSQEWQQYFRTEQPQTSHLCRVRLCWVWAVEQFFSLGRVRAEGRFTTGFLLSSLRLAQGGGCPGTAANDARVFARRGDLAATRKPGDIRLQPGVAAVLPDRAATAGDAGLILAAEMPSLQA